MGSPAIAGSVPPDCRVDQSHRLQAAAIWRRWRTLGRRAPPAAAVPAKAGLPPQLWRHYRHFAWVIHEQRLFVLVLGFLMGGVALVWSTAWHLSRKPPVVVRAGPSLREEAAAFYGAPEISYDQLAFFLQGCLPLLYAADDAVGHPLLALAQGLVAPEIYRAAERRLNESGADIHSHRMTQNLTITEVGQVVADPKSGRAAARLRGMVRITVGQAETRSFPWRARAVLSVNPPGRLNPYPFYLIRLEERTGPDAVAWENSGDNRSLLDP